MDNDTNYETETQFGRGHRLRRTRINDELEIECDVPKKRPVKTSSKPIPAPPNINLLPPVQHLMGTVHLRKNIQ